MSVMFRTAAALAVTAAFLMPSAYAQHAHDASGEATSKPWSQADDVWGADAMKHSRGMILHHHGAEPVFGVSADRLEIQSTDEGETAVWDGDLWYGGDINKLWIKSEGDYSFDDGKVEEAEVQLLWSRAVSSYFDLQTGIRYDIEPKGRTHAVLGFQGMAPYRFEVDGAAFLSDEGDLTASFEAEYELLLTQRLILQPRVSLGWSAQKSRDLEVGAGLTNGSVGLRLRYEAIREFAPYIGVEWRGHFGETEDLISQAGGDADQTVFLLGVRTWY